MTETQLDRALWRDILYERGIPLTKFAEAMDTPFWTIYSYTKRGGRTAPDRWLARAEVVARTMPWKDSAA